MIDAPVLILANKQDLKEALPPEDIGRQLGVDSIARRPVRLQSCVALNG
jgi:signal recognition particle receptor subunit beta